MFTFACLFVDLFIARLPLLFGLAVYIFFLSFCFLFWVALFHNGGWGGGGVGVGVGGAPF